MASSQGTLGGKLSAGQGAAPERIVKRWCGLLALGALLLPLPGCGSFFQCENKPACPASSDSGGDSGSGSTVDIAFVSSTAVDTNGNATSTITGYNLASGALSVINSVTLPFVPIAMAVNPKNSLLYVASVPGATTPGIYEYAIGTDGRLTAANNGAALVTDVIGAMTLSPDGNWLYTLQSTGQSMIQYSVSTTGALQSGGAITLPSLTCVPTVSVALLPSCSVTVSPNKNYVAATYGTQGAAVFTYTSTSGITNSGSYTAIAGSNTSGNFNVVIDGNDKAYISQTNTMSVYALSSLISSPTTYTPAVYTYPTGSVPRAAVADSTSSFVYSANVGTSKITGFATGGTTALTVLAGAPFAAPASVAAIGIDSSNTYLLAAGYDATAGLQLYALAGSGVLTAVKSAGTSTATGYPVLIAMSH